MSKPKKEKPSRNRTGRVVSTVSRLGVEITIKERQGQRNLVFEYDANGRRVRQSSGTNDSTVAENKARVLALELAKVLHGTELGLELRESDEVTLGDLFESFRAIRMPLLKEPREGLTASYKGSLAVAMRAFEGSLGRNFKLRDFDQNTLDRHVRWRADPGNRRQSISLHRGGRPPTAKTGAKDISLLSEIINWGMRTKVGGRPFLRSNPIEALKRPSHREDRRQPVASEARLQALLEAAPRAEQTARENNSATNHLVPGSYLCFLRLLSDYGHRFTATGLIQRQHVLLTAADVAEAAARLGLQPEECARAWPWGAILYPAPNEKHARPSLLPLTRRARDYLLRHLEAMDGAGRTSGRCYLFCLPSDPTRPLVGSSAAHLLHNIEGAATLDGRPLVHLENGLAHPLRRRFRSVRAGRFDDALVALAGGWKLASIGKASVMNEAYLKYPPESLLYCLEFEPIRDLGQRSLPPGVLVDVKVGPLPSEYEKRTEFPEKHLIQQPRLAVEARHQELAAHCEQPVM
ncbi:MAG: hypothetical protein ACYC3Q_02825 [Gemmatimonadaceae bacterium]